MLTHSNLLFFRGLFFCLYGTIGVMFPFLVLHFKTGVGLDDRQVALISSLSGITVILFQQLWGYTADVLLPKKWLIAFATLGSGLLFYFVGTLTQQWSIALVMLAFNSLFTSISQLLHSFLFAHVHSERYFGLLRAWGSLGFVVTNILIGIYADRYANGSLTFIFPVFLGLTAITFLLVLPIPEAHAAPRDRLTFWQVQHHFLHRPEIVLFLLMTFLYQAAHSPSYLLQAVVMSNLGADRATIAYSYSLAAFLELPIFFLAGRLIARFGEHRILLFCCMVQAIRWVLVWSCTSSYQIIATSLLHCITFGLFFAAAVTYMNRHAGAHLKASAQTLYALVAYGFASMAGFIIGGEAVSNGFLAPLTRGLVHSVLHLPDRGDLANLYIACATVAGASVLLAAVLYRIEERPCVGTQSRL
ncbi:MAG: MFS transporter [Candidatus Sumerlaeaceae bacterium]